MSFLPSDAIGTASVDRALLDSEWCLANPGGWGVLLVAGPRRRGHWFWTVAKKVGAWL